MESNLSNGRAKPLSVMRPEPRDTCPGHTELLDQLRKNTEAQTDALNAIESHGVRLQAVEATVAKLLNLKYWLGGIVAVVELLKNHDPAGLITEVVKKVFGG